jgi:hypothetical protein
MGLLSGGFSKLAGGIVPENAKSPLNLIERAFLITSLTITYFHTGCSTIIGAKSFHGPVRDGKGWYRLAMVIRHNLYGYRRLIAGATLNPEEVVSYLLSQQTAEPLRWQ